MQPEEIFEAELVDDAPTKPSEPQSARPGLIEQALSPQSLQWMMLSGGGLLVLGFAAWLWSVGVFDNPIIISAVVGAATLGLLAGGVAMVRLTRYQLAGRGIALLGSVVLPLNLWLYDAQGLVTLANGGQLWIPAALFCLVYAVVARVLRDSKFVYALVGGVVLTGMLFLADQNVNQFWALMPQVTFLVVIGWLSAFADRLFVDDDGDFSRKNFGLAFHRAGLVVATAGLTLLLGGHLVAAETYFLTGELTTLVASSQPHKLWAIGVIACSFVGFYVQGIIHNSRGYRLAAGLLAVWLVPATLNFFSIEITFSHVAITVATVVTFANVAIALFRGKGDAGAEQKSAVLANTIESISLPLIGCLATLACGQLIAQSQSIITAVIFSPLGWISTLQIFTAGSAACAYAWNKANAVGDSKLGNAFESIGFINYLSLVTGVSLLVAAAWSAVFVQTTLLFPLAAALIFVIPIGLVALSFVSRKPRSIAILRSSAVIATTAYLVIRGCVEINAQPIFVVGVLQDLSLRWSAILATSTAIYSAASWKQVNGVARLKACVAGMMSVALLSHSIGFEFGYCLVLAPMFLGLALRVYELLTSSFEEQRQASDKVSLSPISQLSKTANALVLGSGIGGVLLALSRWVVGDVSGTLMIVAAILLTCTTVVSLLTKDQAWRTTFRALIVALVGANLCVFDGWLAIDGWQRFELCSILGGVILLGLGHAAWSREGSEQDETASASLTLGSLLLAVPLAIGLIVYRFGFAVDSTWMNFHEIATIVAGLVLFGSGVCCKLRATTISGASLLGLYLMTLLALVIRLPDQLQSASVMMMVGGGLFFVTALLMSIYRDRLISLPRRIREGEGVYRVLKWR